jgi:hypothetical protein
MIIDSKSCDGDHDDEAAGRAWGGRGIVDLVTDYLILQPKTRTKTRKATTQL